MFDFIKKRDAQTQARKRMKKDLDEIFEFNNEEKQQHTLNHIVQLANNDLKEIGWVRLLDEGTVLYGDGSIRSYIKRGTIKEFYDSLEDDYIGYINIGHINFATLPIFVGQWTKNDLRLVDIGENRQALEVNMKIDESLSVIQDLQKCHIQLVFQPNLWQVMTKNYLTNMNFQLLNIFLSWDLASLEM